MDETKAETSAKQFLRNQIAIVGRDVANNTAQQTSGPDGQPLPTPSPTPSATGRPLPQLATNTPNLITHFQLPTITGNSVSYYNLDLTGGQPIMTFQQLKSIQSDLQGDLDSMNEMSETTSMRLQMAMDRGSKFRPWLTGVVTQISGTVYGSR